MDHGHHVAFVLLTELHKTLYQLLRLLAVVDVADQVAHVVHDQDVGLVGMHAFGDEVIALADAYRPHVEHKELIFGKLAIYEPHHALLQDILGALRILFGVNPHHLQRLFPDTLDTEQPTLLPAPGAAGHQDRDEHRLAGLGLTSDHGQVFSWHTGLAFDVKQELFILDVAGRYDPQLVEINEQGCNH